MSSYFERARPGCQSSVAVGIGESIRVARLGSGTGQLPFGALATRAKAAHLPCGEEIVLW